MIRFLREANVLPQVTHITSVSGGSILAAHLVLNWQRYNDSLEEFDAAAAELIRFVQLDVRNRVVRRYPLAIPLCVMPANPTATDTTTNTHRTARISIREVPLWRHLFVSVT